MKTVTIAQNVNSYRNYVNCKKKVSEAARNHKHYNTFSNVNKKPPHYNQEKDSFLPTMWNLVIF